MGFRLAAWFSELAAWFSELAAWLSGWTYGLISSLLRELAHRGEVAETPEEE